MKNRKMTNWKSFLDQHNLVWDHVVYKGGYHGSDERKAGVRKYYLREWDDGAFIGNGMTGAMIYKESPDAYKFELGRNDVIAHNYLEGIDWAMPRVPIGDIVMTSKESISKDSMALRLYEAEVAGIINTNKGSYKWTVFNHAEEDLMVIEISSDADVNELQFSYRPKHGVSPRIDFAQNKADFESLPPEPTQKSIDGIHLSVQTFVKKTDASKFVKEGACTVAWYEELVSKHLKRVYITIGNSYEDEDSVERSVELIKKSIEIGLSTLKKSHRKWWHEYYDISYLSMTDKKWEKFYWVQMYKLACAVDSGFGVLDSQGPWLTKTPWPTTVWNLNVQLSYSSLYTSGRIKLAESLIKTLKGNEQVLMDNAKPIGIDDGMFLGRATSNMNLSCPWPETYELGNLTWALYYVWRHYSVTGDRTIAEDVLFPFLKASINSYLALLVRGEDEKLHLPGTSSPEYPSVGEVNYYPIMDCNYSLALLNWGLTTLIELNKQLGFDDVLEAKWVDTLSHLTDYPINENGLMVGSEIGFDKSHRHFSHLMMIYPLNMLDCDDSESLKLIETSLQRWLSLAGKLQGYTFTGAATIAALIGDGDRALEYLNGLDYYLERNTMYAEKGPVIETPLSAAESIHNMLIQSGAGVIKIFPAVPNSWRDIEFRDFLAEGAYEVSAKREEGKLVYARIKSILGGKVRVRSNDYDKEYDLKQGECIEIQI